MDAGLNGPAAVGSAPNLERPSSLQAQQSRFKAVSDSWVDNWHDFAGEARSGNVSRWVRGAPRTPGSMFVSLEVCEATSR